MVKSKVSNRNAGKAKSQKKALKLHFIRKNQSRKGLSVNLKITRVPSPKEEGISPKSVSLILKELNRNR